jgi:hypothetical protein
LIFIGKYLLLSIAFLVLNIIEVFKSFLIVIFKLLKLLKNFIDEVLTIVKPFAISSISFQVKESLSTPENIECILLLSSTYPYFLIPKN